MVASENRAEVIRVLLLEALQAEHVEVHDDSGQHLGHVGAAAGGGHYRVLVVSRRFVGLSRLAAQRLVYRALGTLLERDIHAVQIRTLTPDSWRSRE